MARRTPRQRGTAKKRCRWSNRCKRQVAAIGLCNTHLLRMADSAFSAYIRERDGCCVVCGGSHVLQTMHIISRRYRRIRWDPRNAVAGCLMCHAEYTAKPLEWEDWIEHHFGEGTWAKLRAEALDGIPDWKELAVECLNTHGSLQVS